MTGSIIQRSKEVIGAIVFCLILFPGAAPAGSLDSPGAPSSGSDMPTLTDIYNQLDTGAASTPAATFQEPSSGPTTTTGKSLSDIKAKLPSPDNTTGATTGEVLGGKTFWGLRTDGTWGLNTGVLSSRPNVTGGAGSLIITIPDGYYSGGKTATANDIDLVSGNIKGGATIFGVSGDANVANTGSGDAAAGDILNGKTAWVDGAEVAGTMPTQTLSASTATVSAGYYSATTLNAVDADLSSGNIKSGAIIFGVAGASNVVDTSSGNALAGNIPCGLKAWVAGAEVTGTLGCLADTGQTLSYTDTFGEDHDYSIRPPSYTDNGDTVTDNVTGLVWQKEDDNATRNWDDAKTYCRDLTLGGNANWRLPTKKELTGIVDFSADNPAINATFTGTKSLNYWSATAFIYPESTIWAWAWCVSFRFGGAYYSYDKTGTHYVRCVR